MRNRSPRWYSRELPSWAVQLAVALSVVAFANRAFFTHVAAEYPLPAHLPFVASLAILVVCLTLLPLTLLDLPFLRKPMLVAMLLLSSVTAYFMDQYNIVLDTGMIRNVMETSTNESLDLFSAPLFLYFLLLGILPSVLVGRVRVRRQTPWRALRTRAATLVLVVLVGAVSLLAFNRSYASFFREHKPLRYYANRLTCLYSVGRYFAESTGERSVTPEPLGTDAAVAGGDRRRELVILVAGETVRADHLSINGYERETTPEMARLGAVSLTNMTSCSTSTAVSLPCMLSILPADKFSRRAAAHTENLLDVLRHAGVRVLWRDNNTGDKGIAARVDYEDFRTPDRNPDCDIECRDDGMLADLQEYVDGTPDGDVFVVLHQMGNHGPAYYRRYPQRFETFSPVCRTPELGECSADEITNAYDNAIRYTDRFLGEVVEFLQRNGDAFETALFYVSDHGESLGEHGLYLHGMPALMAPKEQTEVAALLWFGDAFERLDPDAVRKIATRPYTHDYVFHTVLGLLEVRSRVYDPSLDILAATRAAHDLVAHAPAGAQEQSLAD